MWYQSRGKRRVAVYAETAKGMGLEVNNNG
jgi:hypothetical protein